MGVKTHLEFLGAFYKLEIASAVEYRFNFISQTVGMFLNDVFWIFFWYILFDKFGSINGWKFQEMLLLNAVLGASWGLSEIIFGNWKNLARMIEEGSLDYYLSLPKNVLMHSLARLSYSGMGDFLFGLTVACFSVSLIKLPLFLLLLCTSTLVILAWGVITGSLAFYIPHFEIAAKPIREGFLTFAFYPFSVYSGLTRFILLFLIPAGFVSGIPVDLLTSFSWKWFLITIGFSISFFSFAVWLFYKGLHRYESGNMITLRG